jgi:hypothetical protein
MIGLRVPPCLRSAPIRKWPQAIRNGEGQVNEKLRSSDLPSTKHEKDPRIPVLSSRLLWLVFRMEDTHLLLSTFQGTPRVRGRGWIFTSMNLSTFYNGLEYC